MSAQPPQQPPMPRPTDHSAEFWAATADGRFLLQRCDRCQEMIFYPRVNCPACGSTDLVSIDASGRGTVFTYTIARRPTHRAFAEIGPYVVAIVELEEGPHVTTNIIGCEPEDVVIGMPVELVFGEPIDDIALPYYRPQAGASGSRPQAGASGSRPQAGASGSTPAPAG